MLPSALAGRLRAHSRTLQPEFLGLEPSSVQWLPGAFHDIMLGEAWSDGAQILEKWVDGAVN